MSLRFFRSGGSKPPLVLVHGFTDNALYYSRLAELLAESWDVVAYDCRGHGESAMAGGKFSDADRVNDLVGLIANVGFERPVLIGHSMGAATIALAVAANPGLSRGIVLEDPAWWEWPAGLTGKESGELLATRLDRNAIWRESLAKARLMSRDDAFAWRRADAPSWSDQDIALSLDARLQVELDLFTYFPNAESPWRRVVPNLDCPTLLVTADPERGAIISADVAAEASTLNPNIVVARVGGAGHAIRYEQFDAFMALLMPFLDGVRRE